MTTPMFSGRNNYLFIALIILPFIMGCSGPQQTDIKTDKKEEIDNLLQQELKNQDNAKYGNKHPFIQVITDSGQVALLRQNITVKMLRQQQAEANSAKKKPLAASYKIGDRTVVPEIISILKGNNKTKKEELFNGLSKDDDDPDTYSITDQAIIDLVLNDIDNPEYENEAVQLAGFNALPGLEAKFEARLLSGHSTDAGRLFFWLGKAAKSQKALTYITTLINNNTISPDDLNGIISGLEGYGQNGSPAMKAKVGDLALLIYQKKLITDDRIEDLRNSGYTSDAAEGLLTCLFEYGDKRVIPIANDILKRKIRIQGPVLALIRLDGPQHLKQVYHYLDNEADFFTGLDLVESIDKKYRDDNMLKDVLIQFAKQKKIDDNQIDRMVRSFTDMKAEDYLKNCSSIISNTDIANRIKKGYALSHIPTDSILADMISAGLIDKKPDAAIIRKAKEGGVHDPTVFMFAILESQKTYISFDSETDLQTVDYDKLLQRMSAKSAGLLNGMLVWMDVKEKELSGKMAYKITVLYKNAAFIAVPQDVDDWYDIMTVNALLDKLLEQSGSPKRFIPVETGDQTVQYIFGIPGAVNKLLQKYKG